MSEEASRDQQTMKICLEEIKRCRKTTPRPNFIVLLGDRYGWRPLPYEIPAIEFEQIESLTTHQTDREFTSWYHRDDNAEPAVFCLRPRELDLRHAATDEQKLAARELEFAKWSETEAELRRILLSSVDRLSLNKEQKLKYESSATEQEIEAGALSVGDAKEHVFCFFRSIQNLPDDKSARDVVDLKENCERFELDSDAHARQTALREERLRGKLPGNITVFLCQGSPWGEVRRLWKTLQKTRAGTCVDGTSRRDNINGSVNGWQSGIRVPVQEMRSHVLLALSTARR